MLARLSTKILCFMMLVFLSVPVHAALPGDPMERMKMAKIIISNTPSKYLACYADTDCTSIMYGCGSWAISNKAELKEFTEAASTVSAAIKCSATDDVAAKPSVICLQNKCVRGVR